MRARAWILGTSVGLTVGLAVSCGRSPGDEPGPPEACVAVQEDQPRVEGEPSPSAVGSCADLGAEAPLYGCSDDQSCDAPVLRCNPNLTRDGEEHKCCSDDPATFDGGLPAYSGHNPNGGLPLFSGDSNNAGTSGVCVRTANVEDPLTEFEASGCPVPCNPTWNAGEVEDVCGRGKVCCQTVQMDERDCIFDEEQQRWRAVTGLDIAMFGPSGQIITDWSPSAHVTHQDPAGNRCAALTGVNDNDSSNGAYRDCLLRLTVANQRGFCREAAECCVDRNYRDVCEQMN